LALDSGYPRLTGTGTLNVLVEDINDHTPTFEAQEYALSVDENVDIGHEIDQLFAIDKDVGLNAEIR
jgi:protocadherin Fat 4